MEEKATQQIVEALIFAADEPLSIARINETLEPSNGLDVEQIVHELNQEYREQGRVFEIRRIAEGYQVTTRPEYSNWIKKMYVGRQKARLSQAALETLAIIAFKQPVSRVEVAQIRGVNSDGVIGKLLERKLITISGRSEAVGRPLLYSTTPIFLQYFGLNNLSDLPKPREIEELIEKDGIPEEVLASLLQNDKQLSLAIDDDDQPSSESEPAATEGTAAEPHVQSAEEATVQVALPEMTEEETAGASQPETPEEESSLDGDAQSHDMAAGTLTSETAEAEPAEEQSTEVETAEVELAEEQSTEIAPAEAEPVAEHAAEIAPAEAEPVEEPPDELLTATPADNDAIDDTDDRPIEVHQVMPAGDELDEPAIVTNSIILEDTEESSFAADDAGVASDQGDFTTEKEHPASALSDDAEERVGAELPQDAPDVAQQPDVRSNSSLGATDTLDFPDKAAFAAPLTPDAASEAITSNATESPIDLPDSHAKPAGSHDMVESVPVAPAQIPPASSSDETTLGINNHDDISDPPNSENRNSDSVFFVPAPPLSGADKKVEAISTPEPPTEPRGLLRRAFNWLVSKLRRLAVR